MRFVLRVFVIGLAAALLLAGWDFSRFVARADRVVTPDPPIEAEAVAALTGAADARIISAIQLADSLDIPLLISGVNVDATPADIARVANVDVAKIDCCVTLGKAAASTEGNGDEVADWARRNKVQHIIVVTSEYHMERALFELHRAMPEGHFIPHAVMTTKVRPADWYRDTSTAKTLIEEWIKYRLAGLRNAALNPESGA
ncbi:MAG: YdcF family protein [Hyphomonadaceae bacterium]|nr:YdcF family protein [Hyphomonadaceae bacterium]MBP9234108.1 YdcF family protein [Hyphomonadaceae bacterium]